MEANRKQVDPSGQELIEGSTIAGEISPVNHRAPWPLTPPTKGRVKLSDDQKIASKKAAGIRYHKKRKIKEDEMMEELGKLGKYSVKLDRESHNLKTLRDRMEAWVDEEYNIILTQLVDNIYAGQNTEVQKARINFTGETSTGQDGLEQEMNQAPITSDTILGENASINLQTLPRSAQPAGSSGLPDDKHEKNKWTTNAVAASIEKLKEKNVKMESDIAVFKAEANMLQKQLDQLRNIREKMAFKDARRNAKLEKVLDFMFSLEVTRYGTGGTGLPVHNPPIYQSGITMGSGGLANEKSPGLPQSHVSQGLTHNHNQGSTLNTQLPLEVTGFGTGGTGLPVHHPSIYQSGTTMGSGGLANENSPGLSQSHVSQGLTHNHNQGSTLNTQLPLELTGFGTGGTGLLVHHPSIYQSGTIMGSGGLTNENSPGLPQSHVSQGLTHNHNQGSTLNTQLPLEVTGFGTRGTGLPVHHPSIYQSGTTMGSGGLANENSAGLPQSHFSQGLTHNHNQGSTLNTQLPFEVTGFGIGGTGLPVHHPPIYQSGTTMGSGGLANENSPGLPQSHVSQGLTHENNFEQPDATYGDQFIEFSGCSNNIDGSYI